MGDDMGSIALASDSFALRYQRKITQLTTAENPKEALDLFQLECESLYSN